VLLFRGLLSLGMIACGTIVIARLLPYARWEVVPGLVLGAAMIALGVHRLSLILRARRASQ
jgi:hypothetical protein